MEHITILAEPWPQEELTEECTKCATSCQSACKTSCTVGNIPCEKRR
ncbi:MAG: six-cysteine ranthipeptide SCIFF [Candidatus Eremiobacteraeota bacterium]|nr:six-cysteine ranthipeptide SCIFF [Candidatus Eremiobacteraeota bacterium]